MYFMLKSDIVKFILLLNIICIIIVLPLTISRSTILALVVLLQLLV
jgi:hypothetical protein